MLRLYIIAEKMHMHFVWDDQKNAINKRKHGLSFEVAIHIFNDANRLEIYDEEHSQFEERYNTIGFAEEVIFCSVYCT